MTGATNTNELTRAVARSRRLYASSQFQGAYVRGARAALAGRAADSCPYRSRDGWAAWRRSWLAGFRSIPVQTD